MSLGCCDGVGNSGIAPNAIAGDDVPGGDEGAGGNSVSPRVRGSTGVGIRRGVGSTQTRNRPRQHGLATFACTAGATARSGSHQAQPQPPRWHPGVSRRGLRRPLGGGTTVLATSHGSRALWPRMPRRRQHLGVRPMDTQVFQRCNNKELSLPPGAHSPGTRAQNSAQGHPDGQRTWCLAAERTPRELGCRHYAIGV